jgi:hypothetical protein
MQDLNFPSPRGSVLLLWTLLQTKCVSFIILNAVTFTGKIHQTYLSSDAVLKHLFGRSLSLRWTSLEPSAVRQSFLNAKWTRNLLTNIRVRIRERPFNCSWIISCEKKVENLRTRQIFLLTLPKLKKYPISFLLATLRTRYYKWLLIHK